MKNKRSKDKARDVDVFGTKLLLPKSTRKKLNKEQPEMKKKKLSATDLPKITEFQKNQKNDE